MAALLLVVFAVGLGVGLAVPESVRAAVDKIAGAGKVGAAPDASVYPSGCTICQQSGWIAGHYDTACMSVARDGCLIVAGAAAAAASAEVITNGGSALAAGAAGVAANLAAYTACVAGCYVPGYYSDRTCQWYNPCPTP